MYEYVNVNVCVCVCCKKHGLTHTHSSLLHHPFCPRYVVIIATKFHYSVDVFLGAALSLFVWKFYHSHIRSMWDAQVNKQQQQKRKRATFRCNVKLLSSLHLPSLTTPTSRTALSHHLLHRSPHPSPSPHTPTHPPIHPLPRSKHLY